jgi:hypothetical protein
MAVGLRVSDDEGHRVHIYALILSFEKQVDLENQLGMPARSLEDDPRLVEALLRWGVGRVESLLADSPPTWDPAFPSSRLVVENDHIPELARVMAQKACEFQVRFPRRLLCSAAIADDPTAVRQADGLTLAPTSDSLCGECAMPDAAYLCTHLVNPEVTGIATDQGTVARRVVGAMCQLGHPEANQQPGGCHAGGHRCWERIVELLASPVETLPALSLVASIDYLDTSWRSSPMSGGKRIFSHKSAATLASLAQPCATRADFQSRITELDAVFKSMDAPTSSPSFTKDIADNAGPLVRLKWALKDSLASNPAALQDASVAIDRLLAVNVVRTGFQHSTTTTVSLPAALATFGIGYPPSDWAMAWKQLEALAVSAVQALARTLSEMS